ncbi:MAG TPA: aminodeoxychorismate/anthranilate synthase component II [Lentisphaeria bacterium]|nr:MAG: aminodeoxychorismate/anthranilate synthase component II [Lentisphaerae bacterium GWF2_38_69]HBM15576.1 aminodeoxychorismate/anthranilate synthase component II [Lentisphaeria bacterium]
MILIIDNYDSFTYNLYQYFAESCTDVKVIRNDMITISEIDRMDISSIILSPGPGRPENAGICVDVIKAFKNKFPILGVCLGHQAMGIAEKGNVIGAPEIMHGKESLVFYNNCNLYNDMPNPFRAGRYHSLIIDRDTLPDTIVVEAETKDGLIMGIRIKDTLSYGVQFHPESMLTPEGKTLIRNFIHIQS